MLGTLAHDRHHQGSMTLFEIFKRRIAQTVSSDSIEEKTMLLDESKRPGFFDDFDEIQVMVLKSGLSDVWRTRLQVAAEQQTRAKVSPTA